MHGHHLLFSLPTGYFVISIGWLPPVSCPRTTSGHKNGHIPKIFAGQRWRCPYSSHDVLALARTRSAHSRAIEGSIEKFSYLKINDSKNFYCGWITPICMKKKTCFVLNKRSNFFYVSCLMNNRSKLAVRLRTDQKSLAKERKKRKKRTDQK